VDTLQAQFKTRVTGVFNRAAATYDRVGPRSFSFFGNRLVEVAAVQPGWSLLDVACGKGAVAIPAARQVGENGRVVGIDLSPVMLVEATVEVNRLGLNNLDLVPMDAETLAFPDHSFDGVLCGLSIFFFPDHATALAQCHRVLKAGGRIGLTTFAQNRKPHWFKEVLLDHLAKGRDGAAASPPPIVTFDTPEALIEALTAAGFVDIEVSEEEADFVYAAEDEWWQELWSHAMRAYLEMMDDTVREQFKTEIFRRIQDHRQADGFHIPIKVLYAVANSPV